MFNLFKNEPYTFVEILNTVLGNSAGRTWSAYGVIKEKEATPTNSQVEDYVEKVSLFIKPNEDFVEELGSLVGHGVIYNSKDYRVTDQLTGRDLDLGHVEFIKLTLKRENIVWQQQSELQ